MIEVIYKEEKTTADEEVSSFSIPRNIRQVGLVGENFRIYMEDYVYTFLKRLSERREPAKKTGHLAILKGEAHWKNEITYLFVRGAVLAGAKEACAERIIFSEENWEEIHREETQYFPDEETVGWFYSEPDLPMRMSSTFDSVHLKYFGADKICMLMDPTEKEEAFFRYENSSLIRQCGYCLYYEKNPQMQTYMIEKKEALADIVQEAPGDDAVKAFRKRIVETGAEENGMPSKSSEYGGFFSYAATACLALAVLAAGLNFYRVYRQMNTAEPAVQSVSSDAAAGVPETPDAFLTGGEAGAESTESVKTEVEENPEKGGNTENVIETVTPIPGITPDTDGSDTDHSVQDKATDTEQVSAEESKETPVSGYETGATSKKDTAAEGKGEPDAGETAAAPMHETYIIRPGDTLFQICLEHYGTLDRMQKLCELNGISENDLIYPGEIIVLP